MSDVDICLVGQAGRITFNWSKALNVLTYDMCFQIEAALDAWRDDAAVRLVVIDAAGEKAFCAGGDVQALHASAVGTPGGPVSTPRRSSPVNTA